MKKRLTSRDLTKLIAADNCGLIPDPWMQTGMVCSTIANVNRSEKTRPYEPDQFIPKRVRKPVSIDDELIRGFEQRRRASGD